jgi:hypothetical protein
MRSNNEDWVHEALDSGSEPPAGAEQQARLRQYRETLASVKSSRVSAPPDLAARVMVRLERPPRRAGLTALTDWLPAPRQWLAPAFAGGFAVALIFLGWSWWGGTGSNELALVQVHFQLHAPGAKRVELVGSFNHWQPGAIQLTGPDASGHWTATVRLPEGRHEYQFLVDGRQWVTDPAAAVVRPDGFGRANAVLDVAGKETTL